MLALEILQQSCRSLQSALLRPFPRKTVANYRDDGRLSSGSAPSQLTLIIPPGWSCRRPEVLRQWLSLGASENGMALRM